MKHHFARMVRVALVTLALLSAWPALAQVQARIDRNPVDLGESLTLTIASPEANVQPDLAPLRVDFNLLDQSSSRTMQIVNGRSSSATVYQVVIEPKRAGELVIPALLIGRQLTSPIALSVRPAPAVTTRAGNADIFLETQVDDRQPYVQQSVGVVLRLFYAVPLVSGELSLDAPDGALLQKVGDDTQGSREINGRRYNYVERRFLLVPERSGALTLPAPRFKGRGAGGWFDDLMGGNSREMRAAGPPNTITVRAQPDGAPQPWLPLRDLRLRYAGAPGSLAAGGSATVIVEGIAQGATQAQLPQIPVPSITGAQVFAEPVQYDETFIDGTPQVKWTQRYAIVPDAAGALVLQGLRIPWWDVRSGQARVATLPDLPLQVGAGSANTSPVTPASTASNGVARSDTGSSAISVPAIETGGSGWRWIAIAFAALWLVTLLWALRRRHAPEPVATHADETAPPPGMRTHADLKRALDTGSLDDVADALRGMARPPARDLDAVSSRLDSAAQRDALDALRRARWAGGDGVEARAQLRAAFADGPRWRSAPERPAEPLPPLYPAH